MPHFRNGLSVDNAIAVVVNTVVLPGALLVHPRIDLGITVVAIGFCAAAVLCEVTVSVDIVAGTGTGGQVLVGADVKEAVASGGKAAGILVNVVTEESAVVGARVPGRGKFPD